MRIATRLLAASAAVILTGSASQAAVIVNDNFDGYANQAAFEAAWTPIGTVAPNSGVLSTAQFVSPSQSIQIPGTATTGQNRNRRTFAESDTTAFGSLSTGETITWSFDFYDSAPTASPARNYSNLQDGTAPTLTNQVVAMGFNNSQSGSDSGGQFYMARILGYVVAAGADPDGGADESGTLGSGAFFKLNDASGNALTKRTLGWHNLKVEISSDNVAQGQDYKFYVDGILAETVNNVGTTVRSYDNIALGSGVSNASTSAFFDNMKLEVVPEPTSLALLSLGGVSIFARRRRV